MNRRKLIPLLSIAAAVALIGAGAGSAGAAAQLKKPATVPIVMHDPGCHWFQTDGKFSKTATVAGRVRLVDLDIATLKVASRHGMRYIRVGKSIVVSRGNYVIMMVGQAVDDNYLELTVH